MRDTSEDYVERWKMGLRWLSALGNWMRGEEVPRGLVRSSSWQPFVRGLRRLQGEIESASTEEELQALSDEVRRLADEHDVGVVFWVWLGNAFPVLHAAVEAIYPGALTLESWPAYAYGAPNEKRWRSVKGPQDDIRRGMKGPWEDTPPEPEEEPSPRYANVDLVDGTRSERWDASRALAPGTRYHLRIDIGRLRETSVVKNPEVFPDEELPPKEEGHWLDVVVTSDQFDVESEHNGLFLPNSGASWVCDCARGGPHHCAPEERDRHLYVAVRSPAASEEATLRIGFYYRNNLLQSQLFTARVGGEADGDAAGYEATIDYTLTRALTDVEAFAPRALNVFTNQNADGSHRVIAVSGDHVRHAPVTDETVRRFLKLARQQLHDVHRRKKTFGGWQDNFDTLTGADGRDVTNAKKREDFVADLRTLARIGSLLYRTIFPGIEEDSQLRRLLRDRSTIQTGFAGGEGRPLLVPWALLYDIDIDPYLPEDEVDRWRICDVVNEWELGEPLADPGVTRCPYDDGSDHNKDVICPFGFWGFKHVLEYLPSWGRKPPEEITVSEGKPEMVVGFSGDFSLAPEHIEALGEGLDVELRADSSKKTILALMEDPDLAFVYFFCHGRLQELPGHEGESWLSTPYLAVGPEGHEERITDRDLRSWKLSLPPEHWQETAPLVFINGCHTAELTPDDLISFVYRFIDASANGVIGTEVVVSQHLASEIALTFFGYFLQEGTPIAEAMRRARLDFLRKGNVMGLAYTAYCDADLHLR